MGDEIGDSGLLEKWVNNGWIVMMSSLLVIRFVVVVVMFMNNVMICSDRVSLWCGMFMVVRGVMIWCVDVVVVVVVKFVFKLVMRN